MLARSRDIGRHERVKNSKYYKYCNLVSLLSLDTQCAP